LLLQKEDTEEDLPLSSLVFSKASSSSRRRHRYQQQQQQQRRQHILERNDE
jgi:hypothetical protein